MTDQVSAEAGSGPSTASVACPEKEIASPTFQVVVLAGVSITAFGGVPAVTVTVVVLVAPALSVTLRPTVRRPAVV